MLRRSGAGIHRGDASRHRNSPYRVRSRPIGFDNLKRRLATAVSSLRYPSRGSYGILISGRHTWLVNDDQKQEPGRREVARALRPLDLSKPSYTLSKAN